MTQMEEPVDGAQDREYQGFSDFVDFRLMIVPRLIQVLFWIGVVLCVIGGAASLYRGSQARSGFELLAGLLTLFLGPVMVRIWAEFVILFFRMNETLTEIKHSLERDV
jgi:hypothetical protein